MAVCGPKFETVYSGVLGGIGPDGVAQVVLGQIRRARWGRSDYIRHSDGKAIAICKEIQEAST